MHLTYDALKARILELTGVPPEDFDADAPLPDFGLDSIKVLELVEEWTAHGVDVGFPELLREPSLNGWWRVLAPKLAARS